MSKLTERWKVTFPTLAELKKLSQVGTPISINVFRAITSLSFIVLIIAVFSLQVFAFSSKGTIPSFKSLEGSWEFSTTWTSPDEFYDKKISGIITIDFIADYRLKDEKNCEAVTLDIVGEGPLTGVVKCADEQYFLCSGHIDECGLPMNIRGDEFNNETELNDTTLMVHPEYKEIRYVLEFNVDKLIYRYQRKNCFISYPHGCLIDAFSWRDIGSYEINKVNNINNKEHN